MAEDHRHSLFSFLAAIFLIMTPVIAEAQSTKVKGRVIDAATGEGIPFAGVYFLNSTVGTSTDMDGYFSLETRVDSLRVLSASMLGYVSQEKEVTPRSFNEVNFSLDMTKEFLNAAVVKPDNRYVNSILRKISKAKDRNDPERRPQYDCDLYSRIELDVTNPKSEFIEKLLPKDFHFIYDYMDTSVVSGLPYLPVMISEANSRYYHSSSPEKTREVIKKSRVSGIESQETVAQFTGGMYVKLNLYDNYINVFEVEIPSPLHDNGTSFYNYYLIDSLQVDGRKTYKFRFHPSKWVSSPTFDGEMSIDAEDFALRDAHVRLKDGANVNWVRDLAIDTEMQRLPDGSWFYGRDKVYADFSVTMRDSSRLLSLIATRQKVFSDPLFEPVDMEKVSSRKAAVSMTDGVLENDEAYWSTVRPYPLSEKEQGIYQMVDSIMNVPLYKTAETVIQTVLTGYLETGKLEYGPYGSIFSFNDLEGGRLQMGVRTTKKFSHKVRFSAYGAYGFKDQDIKGGGTIECMFDNDPTRKLVVTAKHDAIQLGETSDLLGSGDIVTSVLSKKHGRKLSMVNDYSVCYQHEFTQGFNASLALESRRIFSNSYVPMLRPDGTGFNSVGYNQAHLQLRFSKDEITTKGVFDKDYFYSEYPVVTVDLTGSLNGLGNNEYTFFRPEVSVEYTWLMPPIGMSEFHFNAGTIIGTVPYPMLKLHEGNSTYFFNPDSFACMDFYEFASDTWATFFWEHNFKGFFLGKIPLLKRLQWREVFTLKAAYGTVRKENNGIIGDASAESEMLFPEGMNKLNKPYVEMGAGITNIFRLLRIDAFWRMTHRYTVNDEGERVPHDNRFVVNIGVEFKF